MIDWSQTRQVDRRLPTKCNEVTPVFATGGDWVAWDPEKWAPVDENIPTVDRRVDRETIIAGLTDRMPQEGMPQGRRATVGTSKSRGVKPKDCPVRTDEGGTKALRYYLAEDPEVADLLSFHLGEEKINNLAELFLAIRRGLGLDQPSQASGGSAMVVDTAGVSGAGPSSGIGPSSGAGASSAPST